MNLQDLPITTDDLRKQLRMPVSPELEDQLRDALMAAAEWAETQCGRKLETFPELPWQIRAAILMQAAAWFENPANSVQERMTAAEKLLDPLVWQNYGIVNKTV